MNIKKIVSTETDQNCYLISENGKGILIDPGLDTFKIIRETEGIEVNYILLTHCHYDHIYSVNELRKGKIVAGSRKCSENMINPKITLLNCSDDLKAKCEMIFEDGEEKVLDGIKIKAISTPGHTECGMCYLTEDNLFTGDTLFYKSIGRYDLPTGDVDELEHSIKNKLYNLSDEIKVFPGHGRETTIGFEKKNNLYFRK